MNIKLVDELMDVLKKETEIYSDILKISKNKTRIITEGKVSELENIVKLEQSMVLQISRLEDLRENIVEKLSSQLNVDASELTITNLSKHMHNEQEEKLKVCQKELSDILKNLTYINGLNSKLIKNSLEYIDFSINLFTDVTQAGNNYGYSGQVGNSKKRNFFDVKL